MDLNFQLDSTILNAESRVVILSQRGDEMLYYCLLANNDF